MYGPWVRVPAGSQNSDEDIRVFFMPYTYILYSEKLDKYYVGACIEMDRRLHEHNVGHSKFTRLGIPWQLMYKEEHETLLEAKRREMQIKKMKSRKYIEDLVSQGRASRF
jgi:putative endonuclease